jgi:hypothetical protein
MQPPALRQRREHLGFLYGRGPRVSGMRAHRRHARIKGGQNGRLEITPATTNPGHNVAKARAEYVSAVVHGPGSRPYRAPIAMNTSPQNAYPANHSHTLIAVSVTP